MSAMRIRRLAVNAITFSRVPLIVAFAVAAVAAEGAGSPALAAVGCALMFLAGISDLFDGMLARRWRVVSTFGKLADPLMDKVFFIVAFPTLVYVACRQGECHAHMLLLLVFTICYILRDQWVTFMRAVASGYGADCGAMWLGKVRTALSFPAAGLVYVYLAFHRLLPAALSGWLFRAAWLTEIALILLNAWSCFAYTQTYWPFLKRAVLGKKES